MVDAFHRQQQYDAHPSRRLLSAVLQSGLHFRQLSSGNSLYVLSIRIRRHHRGCQVDEDHTERNICWGKYTKCLFPQAARTKLSLLFLSLFLVGHCLHALYG